MMDVFPDKDELDNALQVELMRLKREGFFGASEKMSQEEAIILLLYYHTQKGETHVK